MMPIGISTMPARKLNSRFRRKSRYACSNSISPFSSRPSTNACSSSELAHEANVGRKAVIDQKDEPMEIEHAVLTFFLVEVEIHVARDRSGAGCFLRGSRRFAATGLAPK